MRIAGKTLSIVINKKLRGFAVLTAKYAKHTKKIEMFRDVCYLCGGKKSEFDK
jgi:hypothetical protein